jgi:8-oxo-dGTP pyrophosphatase MutT (NUDIX family)
MRSRPPWFYRQSAVIPYRITESEVEILLITSRGGKRWIIPKGIIDPGMTAVESACKEAYEEAGIKGRPNSAALGKYEYKKWGGVCTVEVFTLQVSKVLEEWPESSTRHRQWMRPKKAAEAIEEPKLKKLILKISLLAAKS